MTSNHIEKVAIVGASGRVGGAFAAALSQTGKHTVTGLSRAGSKSSMAAGVRRVEVDFTSHSSLVSALRGQQFLIITLGVQAPADTHDNIVKAAVEAGVPYIMPNVFGNDFREPALVREDLFSAGSVKKIEQIEQLGGAWVALCCGFWYEWSLALGEQWFGFTIKERKVTFFGDENTKIMTSTWDQCGRAVAALLSLPVSGATPALEQWRNKPLYFSSFEVSQRDMLDSLHRVMGTTDKDWEIRREDSEQRYKDGVAELGKGIRTGFAKAMYTRNMRADGNFKHRGLANEALGLPQEDLDACTKRAVDMVESNWSPFAE